MPANKTQNAAADHGPNQGHMGAPVCPKCSQPMVKREAKGPNGGQRFWGCSRFPGCLGIKLL